MSNHLSPSGSRWPGGMIGNVAVARGLVVLLLGLASVIQTLPWYIAVPAALLAQLGVFALGVIHQIHRWSDRHEGEPFAPGSFILHHGPPILLWNAVGMAVILGLSRERVGYIGDVDGPVQRWGFLIAAGVGLLGLGWAWLAALLLGGNPWLRSVRQRCDPPSLGRQTTDTIHFARYVLPRLFIPMIRLTAAGGLFIALCLGFAVVVFSFGMPNSLEGLANGDPWPPHVQWPIMFLSAAGAWVVTVLALAAFRIVQRARRSGRIRDEVILREAGLAVEAVGFWPAVAWVTMNLVGLQLLWWLTAAVIAEAPLAEGLGPFWMLAIRFSLTALTGWLLLFLPQLYIFTVLTRRDCGWLRAVETSQEIVHLEGFEALAKALLVTLLIPTIIGIPVAIHLLLSTLDRQEILLAAILREKGKRDVEEILSRGDSAIDAALARPHELLAKGRYLDALNGFQLYRHNNPQDVAGIRGEALAMLAMGHVKAREVLERWASESPDDEEAQQYLAEFQAGAWGPNGHRFTEAQSRSTQTIGRGV